MTDIKKTNVVWKLFGDSFLADLFGIFMPGVVAIGATVLIGAFLIWYVTGENVFCMLHGAGANSAYSIGWLFVIALSYAVGAVLYRRGPKHPDYIAAYNQYKKSSEDEKSRLAYEFIDKNAKETKDGDAKNGEGGTNEVKEESEQLKKRKFKSVVADWYSRIFRKYAWIKERSRFNPDFPYPFFRRYLYKRGFSHLADYVNWCEGWKRHGINGDVLEQEGKGNRSKQVINIIKLRLAPFVSSKINDEITRNESHIRLICSLWYVMRYVCFISMIAIVMVFVSTKGGSLFGNKTDVVDVCKSSASSKVQIVDGGVDKGLVYSKETITPEKQFPQNNLFVPVLVVLASIIAIARQIMINIETSIHYVRVRELITIFENAWVYDNKLSFDNKPKLFDDITKAGREFGEKICQKCKHFPKCCPQQNELKEKKQKQS